MTGLLSALHGVEIDEINVATLHRRYSGAKPSASAWANSPAMARNSFWISGSEAIAVSCASKEFCATNCACRRWATRAMSHNCSSTESWVIHSSRCDKAGKFILHSPEIGYCGALYHV